MLSIDKVQAKKLRAKLIQFTAVERSDGDYNIQMLHENGSIYSLRMVERPRPVIVARLDTAKNLAKSIGFDRWTVRHLENN